MRCSSLLSCPYTGELTVLSSVAQIGHMRKYKCVLLDHSLAHSFRVLGTDSSHLRASRYLPFDIGKKAFDNRVR